ncbi:MAG: ribosome silencing factor [bacterium]|nr:ribosome silencing factor [bacterium]MBU1918463.1 ribosome silencing factor [bacterium]
MTQNNLLTKTLFNACLDKKGVNPILLDLSEISSYAEHVIIVSGTSDRQVQALSDHILDMAKEKTSLYPVGVEGYETGLWVLIDFGYVVCHVFQEEVREEYHLEDIWPRVKPVGEEAFTSYFVKSNKKTASESV